MLKYMKQPIFMSDTNVNSNNIEYTKDEITVKEDVFLENLPQTANHILNILWDRNTPMTVAQLEEAVNTEYEMQWSRKEIQQFTNVLVRQDYVATKRKGFRLFYYALGIEEASECL